MWVHWADKSSLFIWPYIKHFELENDSEMNFRLVQYARMHE